MNDSLLLIFFLTLLVVYGSINIATYLKLNRALKNFPTESAFIEATGMTKRSILSGLVVSVTTVLFLCVGILYVSWSRNAFSFDKRSKLKEK